MRQDSILAPRNSKIQALRMNKKLGRIAWEVNMELARFLTKSIGFDALSRSFSIRFRPPSTPPRSLRRHAKVETSLGCNLDVRRLFIRDRFVIFRTSETFQNILANFDAHKVRSLLHIAPAITAKSGNFYFLAPSKISNLRPLPIRLRDLQPPCVR
jgi:hypothetical protein